MDFHFSIHSPTTTSLFSSAKGSDLLPLILLATELNYRISKFEDGEKKKRIYFLAS